MATERSSDTVVRVYTSRRPPEQEDEYVKRGGKAGYAVLMVLFLILTYRDIVRLFQ